MTAADPSLAAYFAEAATWDLDRVVQSRRGARIAWLTALAAVLCAIASSLALVLLMPLKQVEPFVIRVDNSTGIVDVVPAFVAQEPMAEAVTRYFLTHYVSICERFNYSTAENDYDECGAFHSAQRNQLWYARWNRSNPLSPLNVHKDGSVVEVQVSALSFLQHANGVSNTAQVRYRLLNRAATGAPEVTTYWVATVRYSYAAPAVDPKVRRWNPLGFRILDFVSEAEVAGESSP